MSFRPNAASVGGGGQRSSVSFSGGARMSVLGIAGVTGAGASSINLLTSNIRIQPSIIHKMLLQVNFLFKFYET